MIKLKTLFLGVQIAIFSGISLGQDTSGSHYNEFNSESAQEADLLTEQDDSNHWSNRSLPS